MSSRGNQRIRRLVLDRCEGRCEITGRWLREVEVHHRRPGGHGGTDRPGQHEASNLIAITSAIHNPGPGTVHGSPAWSTPLGYLVRTGHPEPRLVPVLLRGVRWVFLTDDGGYVDVPEPLLARQPRR